MAAVLSAEELAEIHCMPEIQIRADEVRPSSHQPKFLSYAAVASPNGSSFGSSPPQQPTLPPPPGVIDAGSPSRPSFADKLKAGTQPSPPVQSKSNSSSGGRRKNYVTLSSNSGGQRRY